MKRISFELKKGSIKFGDNNHLYYLSNFALNEADLDDMVTDTLITSSLCYKTQEKVYIGVLEYSCLYSNKTVLKQLKEKLENNNVEVSFL
jgi:hypothetical protein